MRFYRFWRSSEKRGISSSEVEFDLFSQLSYMAAIAATGAERRRIFQYASESPCASSRYFKEIDDLAQRLGYDYGEACRIIGQNVEEENIRSLLLRLSASLSSGERTDEFLSRESRVQAEAYTNRYERDLERLSGWTLAWVGLIVSTALIIVIALISSLIFPAGASITIFVTSIMAAMFAVSVFGAWFIYRVAPHEVKFHSALAKFPERRLPGIAFKVLLPASLISGVAMAASGVDAWIILLVCGILVFPVGLMSLRLDRRIDSKDNEVGTFFRSLGGVTTAIGMTLREGLDRLDKHSMPSLRANIERLCSRLGLGLAPEVCWQRFSAETGSETVRRSSEMFYRATELGGDTEKIGEQTSLFSTTLSLLRAKRRITSSTFRWICIGTHAVSVVMLVFIVELVTYFAEVVQDLQQEIEMEAAQEYLVGITGNIFLFNFEVAENFPALIIPAVLVLTVVNAFVSQVTEGGHWHKFFFFLGITLILSSLALWGMPLVVDALFENI